MDEKYNSRKKGEGRVIYIFTAHTQTFKTIGHMYGRYSFVGVVLRKNGERVKSSVIYF